MTDFEYKGFMFPYIRFFNASQDGETLDFYIGNTLVAAGIKFGSFTRYIKTGTGTQSYKVTKSGNKNFILQKINISQNVGDVITLAIIEPDDNNGFKTINEPSTRDNTEYCHIRVCNLSDDIESCDIYAGSNMILQDLKTNEISNYMEIIPGKYTLKVYENEIQILNCGVQNLRQRKFNTLYIIGEKEKAPNLISVLSVDAGSYSGFYL